MTEQIFFFKIISLGDYYRQFKDSKNVQNKPMLLLDNNKRKWGNSYIIFLNCDVSSVELFDKTHPMYAGKFEVDRNLNTYIKMIKRIDIPCKKPDYYIITMNLKSKIKLTTEKNLIRNNNNSMIFSNAYHLTDNNCLSQSIFVVADGDTLLIDGKKQIFIAETENFSNIS